MSKSLVMKFIYQRGKEVSLKGKEELWEEISKNSRETQGDSWLEIDYECLGRWGVSGPPEGHYIKGKRLAGIRFTSCHDMSCWRLFKDSQGLFWNASWVFGSSSNGVFIWIYLRSFSGKFFCLFFFFFFLREQELWGDFSDLLQLWRLQTWTQLFLVSIFWHLSAYNAAKRCLFSILSSRKLLNFCICSLLLLG